MVQSQANLTTLIQALIQGQTSSKGIHIRPRESMHVKIHAETSFNTLSYMIYKPTASQNLSILVKDSNLDRLALEAHL